MGLSSYSIDSICIALIGKQKISEFDHSNNPNRNAKHIKERQSLAERQIEKRNHQRQGKAAKLKHVVPPNALPYPHACNSENPNNDTVVVIVRNTDVALGAVVGIFRHIHIAIH